MLWIAQDTVWRSRWQGGAREPHCMFLSGSVACLRPRLSAGYLGASITGRLAILAVSSWASLLKEPFAMAVTCSGESFVIITSHRTGDWEKLPVQKNCSTWQGQNRYRCDRSPLSVARPCLDGLWFFSTLCVTSYTAHCHFPTSTDGYLVTLRLFRARHFICEVAISIAG